MNIVSFVVSAFDFSSIYSFRMDLLFPHNQHIDSNNVNYRQWQRAQAKTYTHIQHRFRLIFSIWINVNKTKIKCIQLKLELLHLNNNREIRNGYNKSSYIHHAASEYKGDTNSLIQWRTLRSTYSQLVSWFVCFDHLQNSTHCFTLGWVSGRCVCMCVGRHFQ